MKKLIILFFLSTMLLVACNPTEIEVSDSSDWELQLAMIKDKKVFELPDKLDAKVTDGLVIDADILVSKEKNRNEASELVLTRHIYTDKEIQENMISLIEASSFNYTEMKKRVKSSVDEWSAFETEIERTRYDLELDTYNGICSTANGFMLTTIDSARVVDLVQYPFEKRAVQFSYEEKQELDFGKWEEAWKSIQNVLKECDVELLTDMHCYTLDLENLQNNLEKYHAEGADFYFQNTGEEAKYTKEDEVYFFQFQQGYNGIPICKYQLDQILEKQDFGYGVYSNGYAMYSGKGLIYISTSNLFDIEDVEKSQRIVPLSDILEKSVSYLKTLATGDTSIEVKEISLCYLPTLKDAEKMEFQAIPVWVVAYIQTSAFVGETEVTVDYSKYDVFNAFSGERIY